MRSLTGIANPLQKVLNRFAKHTYSILLICFIFFISFLYVYHLFFTCYLLIFKSINLRISPNSSIFHLFPTYLLSIRIFQHSQISKTYNYIYKPYLLKNQLRANPPTQFPIIKKHSTTFFSINL